MMPRPENEVLNILWLAGSQSKSTEDGVRSAILLLEALAAEAAPYSIALSSADTSIGFLVSCG